MNIYRSLISHFYPTFEQQFNQQIQKLTSKVSIEFNNRIVNFESSVKVKPQKKKKVINFLISSDCVVYEVTYLGLPLNFKGKMVRFFENLQMLSIELPINPSGKTSVNLTFKYYCTQSPYISFAENSFNLDNRGGFFPLTLPKDSYPAEIELVIPQGWHLLAGTEPTEKNIKYDGQHLRYKTSSKKLSFMTTSSLKTKDSFDNISIILLYPRPYLNQARSVLNLTKDILSFLNSKMHTIQGNVNIAIVEGDFKSCFDGTNILLSSSFLHDIKNKGKTPKDREKLLFTELAKLMPNYFYENIVLTHPDEKWVLEGIIEFLGLAAVKENYGREEYQHLISNYQLMYLESIGFKRNLSLTQTSKGLGKNTDLNYPLNILLFHSLDFLTQGKVMNLLSDLVSWEELGWEVLEEKILETMNVNIKWFTKCYVDKQKPIDLSIARLDMENLNIKATLLNPDNLWESLVELKLIMEDNVSYILWDGISPIQTTGKVKEVVLDPNLYIPGNSSPKIYNLVDENKEEKVGI